MRQRKVQQAKKLIAGVLAALMLSGSAATVYAAPDYEDEVQTEMEAAEAEEFYTSHAIKMTTNVKLGRTFDSGSWHVETELLPEYEGIEWPVKITCGYKEFLWTKSDYITEVGGTATGYRACGLVANDGDTKYTKWIEPTRLSGKVSITHKGELVTYGVKIHFGD